MLGGCRAHAARPRSFPHRYATCVSVLSDDDANANYSGSGDEDAWEESFLAYHSCKNAKSGGYFSSHFWNGDMCRRVRHVVRMDDYFQATRGCVRAYCERCDDACAYEGECDMACAEDCASYYNVTEGTMSYYGCAGPYTATDGLEYYYGPICSSSGGVTRGYFLDEDCEGSVGLSDDVEFYTEPWAFDMFKFVNATCTGCTLGDVCETLYDSSFHCSDRSATAVATGESASWQHMEQSMRTGGGASEDGERSENPEDGNNKEDEEKMEYTNQLCFVTSTGKRIEEYEAHRANRPMTAFQIYAVFIGVVAGLVLLTVGPIWLGLMCLKYHERHTSMLSGKEGLFPSTSTDSEQLEMVSALR